MLLLLPTFVMRYQLKTPSFNAACLKLTALYLLASAPASQAATIDVECTTTALIAAINTANDNGEPDELVLPDSCVYNFTVADNSTESGGANALPVITSEITVTGNNAVIQRPLPIPNTVPAARMRFFQITDNGELTLTNVTLQNGHGSNALDNVAPIDGFFRGEAPGGGAILAAGDVTLIRVSLLNNRTGDGSTTIIDFSANGGAGGAVATFASSVLVVQDSLIDGNQTGDSFNRNAPGAGGALSVNGASMLVDRTTISNNNVGNAAQPFIAFSASIIDAFPSDSFRLTRSTISGNGGTSNVANQVQQPGMFFNNSSLTNIEFTHNTFFDNNSGVNDNVIFIDGAGAGSTIIRNNIFEANSNGASACSIASGALNIGQSTGNVFSDNGGSCAQGANNMTGVSANVLPLAFNGGRNPTHNLPTTSPALDIINQSVFVFDQRGPVEYGQSAGTGRTSLVDAGAVELINVTPISNNLTSLNNVLNEGRQQDWYSVQLAEGETVSYTVSFSDAVGDVDTFLVNMQDLNDILAVSQSTTDDESIEFTAPTAGEYWFVVFGFGSALNTYDLSVSIERNEFCVPIRATNGNIAVVCL